ncbi:hypothetical protein [Brevundimonas faecalis]
MFRTKGFKAASVAEVMKAAGIQ